MSYADFAGILLTATSLIVAIIGLAVALAAFWGYTQFQEIVRERTHKAVVDIAPSLLVNELRQGSSKQVLIALVAEFFANEENQPGVAKAWAEQRKQDMAALDDLDRDPEV